MLTGAGLVKDADFPTSVELANNLKCSLQEASTRSGDSESETRDSELARLHLATYRFLNGGIRFQQGILDSDPDASVNIEQLAIVAEELQGRARNPLSPYTSGWHSRILELERDARSKGFDLLDSFLTFIYDQLGHWLDLNSSRAKRISYLRQLFEICSVDPKYPVDVFSLNYDLCIEYALQRLTMIQFENGFTERDGWNPSTLNNDSVVRLFKLHGSLDWVDDDAYGLCSLQFPRHIDAENVEGDNVRPLLVFGTSHKLSPREPFLSLIYSFSQRVLVTSVLATIGYSFGDNHVNQIIRQGIERNPRLSILVVDPNADTYVRNVPFLVGRYPRVVPLSMSAKDSLDQGLFLSSLRELVSRSVEDEPFGRDS